MSNTYVIGLIDSNGYFENFKYTIKDYQNFSDENSLTIIKNLNFNYNPLQFFDLSQCICENDDIFDCFDELDDYLKGEFHLTTIFLISDIHHFLNLDDIRKFFKNSDFNYLEFLIESNCCCIEIEKLESFIINNCK